VSDSSIKMQGVCPLQCLMICSPANPFNNSCTILHSWVTYWCWFISYLICWIPDILKCTSSYCTNDSKSLSTLWARSYIAQSTLMFCSMGIVFTLFKGLAVITLLLGQIFFQRKPTINWAPCDVNASNGVNRCIKYMQRIFSLTMS